MVIARNALAHRAMASGSMEPGQRSASRWNRPKGPPTIATQRAPRAAMRLDSAPTILAEGSADAAPALPRASLAASRNVSPVAA